MKDTKFILTNRSRLGTVVIKHITNHMYEHKPHNSTYKWFPKYGRNKKRPKNAHHKPRFAFIPFQKQKLNDTG